MSDYTSRELDIMYREAFEAGQEQGRVDMARIVAERGRLRAALERITEFDNPPRYRVDVNTAYSVAVGAVNIARTALQEDREDD